jgi:hypothetical protein
MYFQCNKQTTKAASSRAKIIPGGKMSTRSRTIVKPSVCIASITSDYSVDGTSALMIVIAATIIGLATL